MRCTQEGRAVSSVHFETTRAAREGLSELLTAAAEGRPASVQRGSDHRLAVLDGQRFVRFYRAVAPSRAEVVPETDGYSILLPGLPVHGDGDTLDEAVAGTVEALRDYAHAWSERLRLAPNHEQNDMLVQFVVAAADDELRDWLLA